MSVRRCACPCGEPLPPDAPASKTYRDERHKQRAYRERKRLDTEAPTLLGGVGGIRRRGRLSVRGRRRAERYIRP